MHAPRLDARGVPSAAADAGQKTSGRRAARTGPIRSGAYLLVDDELEPLGLLDDDEAPPLEDESLLPPLDDEPLIAPPPEDELPVVPPALLVEPPVPELDDVSDGEVVEAEPDGDVEDEEDELPGTGTTVVDEDDEPLGVVEVEPPGTTVVVSFFSQPASASAPTSTNR
jgi:hypothetical protein